MDAETIIQILINFAVVMTRSIKVDHPAKAHTVIFDMKLLMRVIKTLHH